MKVTVTPSNREFETRQGEPILTAALREHLNLSHSCKTGSCGVCRARVLRGRFEYPDGRPVGIGAAEEAAGHALICKARAHEDLVIEMPEIRHVTDVEIRALPARVERMERLARDVMGLWLRLPAVEPFAWQAGQYVDVMLPGERRRSFSLANPPHDA
ncbi:MAG: 2Fe-2S iron-sulfur cluster-binding protein, partial [Woeseiaceae bacterium]